MIIPWLKQTISRNANPLSKSLPKDVNKDDIYAIFSDAAYQPLAKSEEIAKKHGYSVDPDLSTPDATTFVKDGRAIVAYRGTSQLRDLVPDLHIAIGSRKHKRFDDAEELARRAAKKYKTVDVAGHSLGGTQALHVNDKLGLNAHVFNPGATLGDKVKRPNVRVVRDNKDVISAGLSVPSGQEARVNTKSSSILDKALSAASPMGVIRSLWRAHSIF